MKYSESWLREWVNPPISRENLCRTLTLSGFEVENSSPVAGIFNNVLVGEIVKMEKHPKADRLMLCEVSVGQSKSLNIVCGAKNARVGMKAPVAIIGAVLPNNIAIKPSIIRDIASEGMLCAARELGLEDNAEGLLELPQDAPIGKDIRNYLNLDDYIIEIAITPNRGDCLSIKGLAREISALTQTPLNKKPIPKIKSTIKDHLPITIEANADCPHYAARIIRQINPHLRIPQWLKERLQRSHIRSIHPIVDVTNYVMLELGQPMHAFDLNKIEQGIYVRHAKSGEEITLLDDSKKILNTETLIIADHKNPLAIAGVMGGKDSGVTLETTDILLESAYFSPTTVARQRQHYGLQSDSAYRYERGVDPTLQQEAIERATQYILDIVGGKASAVMEIQSKNHLPKTSLITLFPEKVSKVLGITLPNKQIENLLTALHFEWKWHKTHWKVYTPVYRFDLSLPEDLIEEIARLYGYDNIPTHSMDGNLQIHFPMESDLHLFNFKQAFRDQGYHEIISYSFIDEKLQTLLDPKQKPHALLNPITADMTVMRTNLWPGLIQALLYNLNRQQHRIRLFEIGTCFITEGNRVLEQPKLSGLAMGLANQEQWAESARKVDFYDVKGDVENILYLALSPNEFTFKPESHPALHPGQSAGIYYLHQKIGSVGALHPNILQALDLANEVFIFELDLSLLQKQKGYTFQEISKFPEIRRDIAILVNQTIPVKEIQDTIKKVAGDWLKDLFIFDVYQGKGITPGLKSVAFTLILQHSTRTLVDDEVASLIGQIVSGLKEHLGAELRS